ncbi:conjugal transfer protein [Sulfuracidifex tepidarius]|uniref:Uncharacterized protein n=1 Tax=Sulfuracidifex tepidarius TaxID=1294262 RepID=A0A510E5H9_9CREN|nr:conjugal transfer protein [Sulfuracidifex tepidarius]BBG27298.1 hypothetical protein IC007_1843 [Sulfuracidifex tepidarius]
MKALVQVIKDKAKAVAGSAKIPVTKYRKGNHEAAMGGFIAGLAMLGGSLASTFDSSFSSLLGSDASYITDFMALIGFVSLIGGVVEYKSRK